MKNTLFKTVILKTILAVSVLFSLTAQAKTEDLTLMLDWFVNPNHGPIVIAQQNDLFKAQGLNVTIQEPADPTLPPKLVAAGKADMAITYMPNMIMDIDTGLPLVRSATLIATPLNTLIVLDNNKIKTLADLKGKKVGISVAGNEEAFVGTMLKSAGLAYKDVTIINVGWNLSTSLASGQVDAIWGGFRNFEINQLAMEGVKIKAFYPEEHSVPSYDELVFVVNKNSYNASTVAKFNTAITQATQYIVNHPAEAWKTFTQYSPKMLNTELNKKAWDDSLTRFALRPSASDLNRYQQFSVFLNNNHIIKNIPADNAYFVQP